MHSAYDQNRGNVQYLSWHGSLLEGKRDRSGLDYRRNRQYDPTTGRFTQEDPIGLAGGLNLYGYANGDPVNFSDPFGLCPMCLVVVGRAAASVARGYIEAKVLGEEYTLTDAGLDALSGAVGAVGMGSKIKLAAREARTVANGGRFSAATQRTAEAAQRTKNGGKLKCVDCDLDLDANPKAKRRDHKQPWARGGGNDAENLEYRCETCNAEKSDTWPWPPRGER